MLCQTSDINNRESGIMWLLTAAKYVNLVPVDKGLLVKGLVVDFDT